MDTLLTTRLGRMHMGVSAIDQQLEYEAAVIARHTARISQLEEEKSMLVKCVGTIDRCIQIVSANGIGKIEGMVTDGLQRVFNNDHIGLVVEKKESARGNSYRILVKRGDTIGNPMDSFGGGIQNVVSFLLRVILIKRFKLAPFLCLDEQFSNVSPEYQPRIAQLLKTLAGLGFTIFAVSHQAAITGGADAVYELTVHCPKCGYDITPQYPYTEPAPKTCPGCQTERKSDAVPRLRKVEGLKLEELYGERPPAGASQP
jgi:DNA repair exonuclease SbcCD ATPase subunit